MSLSPSTADLVIHGGVIVAPDPRDQGQPRHHRRRDQRNRRSRKHAARRARRSTSPGLHILPGAIDVHVHFRDPGYVHKEDFASGTAAAAFGGVTTIFDMPNTIPTVATAEALAAKHRIAREKAYVDFGLYAVLGEESLEAIEELIDVGVIGFKLYMGNTFGRIATPSTGAMLELFERVAPTGKRISLHAETNSIMERRESRLRAAGRIDALAHLAARPDVVAIEAVARAVILAEWTGARIHVLHISSAAELRPLAEGKARGVDVTGETCRTI